MGRKKNNFGIAHTYKDKITMSKTFENGVLLCQQWEKLLF
jgi:hypothetical protein